MLPEPVDAELLVALLALLVFAADDVVAPAPDDGPEPLLDEVPSGSTVQAAIKITGVVQARSFLVVTNMAIPFIEEKKAVTCRSHRSTIARSSSLRWRSPLCSCPPSNRARTARLVRRAACTSHRSS